MSSRGGLLMASERRIRRMRPDALVGGALLCALASACGGRAESTPSDGGAEDDGNQGGHDGSVVDSSPDSPSTACVSASGYAVCGGPNGCFPPASRGKQSECWSCTTQGVYGYQTVLCENAVDPFGPDPGLCADGQVYVEAYAPKVWMPFPFDVGQLFASNGAADRVRYADWSAWTGDPLPLPATCPSFQGFSICGGDCDPCPPGQQCTGRSPQHPYGLCATLNPPSWWCDGTSGSCGNGEGCVIFTVSTADQPIANKGGICFPGAQCQAIASQYPGGASCHLSQ